MIGVAPAIVSHNTDIFGRDARCFKPERWLTEDQRRQTRMVNSVELVSLQPLWWKTPDLALTLSDSGVTFNVR